MPKFYAKLHESLSGRKVVAVSDLDVFGKVLEDSDLGISIKVSEEFYGGDLIELEEVINMIKSSDNVNVIGTRIVDALIDERLVDPKNVITIMGVKHAQIYGSI